MDNIIEKFKEHSIKHHLYTLDGDWKNGNKEIKKINSIYEKIIKDNIEFKEKLLDLIYSEKYEVAVMAATYSMKFNSEKCLIIFEKISQLNIPHISFASKQAIKNWNNKEWFIE